MAQPTGQHGQLLVCHPVQRGEAIAIHSLNIALNACDIFDLKKEQRSNLYQKILLIVDG